MRRALLALAAAAAVAGGLLSATGSAAAAGNTKFPSPECETKVHAAMATGTAQNNEVTCVDKKANATNVAAPCVLWYWYWNRTDACSVEQWVLTVYLIPSGEVIGQNYFQSKETVQASPASSDWTHDIEFTELDAWGAGVGARLFAGQVCSGQCGPIAGTINGPALAMFVPIRGFGVVRGSVFAAGDVAAGSSAWRFWLSTPSGSSDLPPGVTPTVTTAWTPTIRCDIAVPGWKIPGCVFPDYIPTLTVVQASYPSYYKHIRDTQAFGVTSLLTRMVDPDRQKDNTSRACPGMYPRPAGFQCDEYPFASTFEGAFTGGYAGGQTLPGCQVSWLPVRTSSAGYSSCMIPESENRNGGIDLNAFYLNNRVIDRDRFYVVPL
jgi:hypothetical protein